MGNSWGLFEAPALAFIPQCGGTTWCPLGNCFSETRDENQPRKQTQVSDPGSKSQSPLYPSPQAPGQAKQGWEDETGKREKRGRLTPGSGVHSPQGQTYLRSHHAWRARRSSLPLETLREAERREQSKHTLRLGHCETHPRFPEEGQGHHAGSAMVSSTRMLSTLPELPDSSGV